MGKSDSGFYGKQGAGKSLEKSRQKKFMLNRQKSLQNSLDCVAKRVCRDEGGGAGEKELGYDDEIVNKQASKPRSLKD